VIGAPRSGLTARLSGAGPSVIAAFGCCLLVLAMPPVSDHAYQFHLGRRMLDGAVLYVDVAASDMHPPLFTWMTMAVEWLARWFGMGGLALFPFVIALCAALSIGLLWRVGPRSPVVLAAVVLAVLPLSGPFFGQGEHIAVFFALPYLFAASHDAPPLGRFGRLGVASLAAFGLAMKPHFALVWVAAEVYRARRLGVRSMLRLESIAIGAAFVLYVAVTALLHPQLFALIPWVAELYPRFFPVSLSTLLLDWRGLLLLAAVLAAFAVQDEPAWNRVAHLVALAGVATWLAMLLQFKGWGYHWYPVVAFSVIVLGVRLRRPLARTTAVVVPAAAVAALLLAWGQADRTARVLTDTPTHIAPMIAIAEQHASGRAIMALSQYIQAVFPLVGLVDVRWPAPYAHLWMVHAIRAAPDGQAAPDIARWEALEQQIMDRMWAAIDSSNPALLIVEHPLGPGMDMRRYFESDARFRALFARAVLIDTVGTYVVYGLDTQPE
jgi:hypothetical protein